MRRFIFLIVPLLLACRLFNPPSGTTPTPVSPTESGASAHLTPLPAGSPEPSATPSDQFNTRYHPDGGLYVGDRISIEVMAPNGYNAPENAEVEIQYNDMVLGKETFQSFGLAGRRQATFYWVWDTKGLAAGPHALSFSILPGGPRWVETIQLQPFNQLPPPEPDAHWDTLTTTCCILHYITGTDAARDLKALEQMANTQAQKAEKRMNIKFDDPVEITFLSRTLGHGGFASDQIYVTYQDMNYAGGDPAQVLHHEMIHILDRQLGGENRPVIFVEGLATYLSDGHFKREALLPRAGALLKLNWYIPLTQLADAFYPSQHEIGYLEGAALIGYLEQTYGWERFNHLYRNMPDDHGQPPSQMLDEAFKQSFGLSLQEVEAGFMHFLSSQPVTDADITDLRLTVTYYDLVRRYQRQMDTSAYFMTAWLGNGPTMRGKGIVTDYLRHPAGPKNIEIEQLLVKANQHLLAGEYNEVDTLLRQVNVLLNAQ